MRKFEEYLGDGVYASFDGYQIWLRTQQGDEIAIEPNVFLALERYRNSLPERVNQMRSGE